MRSTIDFDQIREDHNLPERYTDAVLTAYADSWHARNVPWSEFVDSFCGTFEALDEDTAIGEVLFILANPCDGYLNDLSTDSGELLEVPDWIRHNIDWQAVGRVARFNGTFRAVRLESTLQHGNFAWAIFRNWPYGRDRIFRNWPYAADGAVLWPDDSL